MRLACPVRHHANDDSGVGALMGRMAKASWATKATWICNPVIRG